jgi:hypothetical protein
MRWQALSILPRGAPADSGRANTQPSKPHEAYPQARLPLRRMRDMAPYKQDRQDKARVWVSGKRLGLQSVADCNILDLLAEREKGV